MDKFLKHSCPVCKSKLDASFIFIANELVFTNVDHEAKNFDTCENCGYEFSMDEILALTECCEERMMEVASC